MKIEGIVENIIFKNQINNYTVLKMKTDDGEIVAVGYIADVKVGDSIDVEGELIYHDK